MRRRPFFSTPQTSKMSLKQLQSLFDLNPTKILATHPMLNLKRLKRIHFISKVLNYFLRPFIKVEMSLSEQLRDLSTYSHLITALWTIHRLAFITGALLADSQAIVKSIFL